ncbi:hypothetical protein GCM10027591_04540 [Zhihengliuella somnathii]
MSDVFTLDYSGLTGLPSSGETIRTQGAHLERAAKHLQSDVDDAKQKWTGMGPLYAGPGETTLQNGFDQPATDAEQLVGNATKVKSAADTLADAIDDLNTRQDTFRTETVPQLERLYDDARDGTASDWSLSLVKGAYQGILQQQIDTLATEWHQAQQDFNTALGSIGRVATDTAVHFDYGSNSTAVSRTEQLYKAATTPGATPNKVEAYYAYLATLTEDEVAAFAATNPEARVTPPTTPDNVPNSGFPTGEHGAEWWRCLGKEQQNALIAALPALVGNTNGVPYAKRNQANRNTLDLVRNDPDPAYSQEQRKAFESIYTALADHKDNEGSNVPKSLLHFIPVDPASQRPFASVGAGNVDTADDVTVTVSGMGSGTHNMSGEAGHGSEIDNNLDGNRAVITWLGYDSPDKPQWDDLAYESGIPRVGGIVDWFLDAGNSTKTSTEVLRSQHADIGGTKLAHFLDGLHEIRDAYGDPPTTNVLAHSYGTTTAAEALVETQHDVDRYVMVGSAGIDPDVADHASDFNVKEDEDGRPSVYATVAFDDPYAPLGQMGSGRVSPTAEEFGAYTFSSDGEGNMSGGVGTGHDQSTEAGDDKWGYIEPGSQSFTTVDKILSGDAEDVEWIDESRVDKDPDGWARHHLTELRDDLLDQGIDYLDGKKDDAIDKAKETGDHVKDWGEDRAGDVEDGWNWVKDKVT